MINRLIKDHKIFIKMLIFIIIIFYILNFFISKEKIILGGEYIFSFDHFGHVVNLLNDTRTLYSNDNTNCFDCPDFYHYSRWYSFFKIGYHSIAQFMGLHPFLFLLLSMVITQLISLYIFTRILFKKFSWLGFFTGACIFILYPYKYSLLIETHDGLLYSAMLLIITVVLWVYKNLGSITIKKTMVYGGVSGLIFSTFLNINIAFLPISIYTLLVLSAIYWKEILTNKLKLLNYYIWFVIPAFLINLPLLQSLLEYGNSRHYEGYISFNAIDSFLVGLDIAKTNNVIVFAYITLFVLILLLTSLTLRYKLLLFLSYLFIGVMIYGQNSPINIYGWMFDHLPLFDSLRSTYRFMFFQFLVLYILVYFVFQYQHTSRLKKVTSYAIATCLFILPIWHILGNTNYFFTANLPKEYFEVRKYLNQLKEEKIYFPPSVPLFHNIATDYIWGDKTYSESILLYKNPYTSLLPIRNIIQFERFPYALSPKYLELYYLTSLKNSPEQIIKALELRGVRYIIFDKNYLWSEIFPDFPINNFIAKTQIEKQFGNIYILKIKDKSKDCKGGYGVIELEYCYSTDRHTRLNNKSYEEYILETQPESIGKYLFIRKNSVYTKSILDPQIHQTLKENKILFSKEVMQVSGNQQKIFYTEKLKKGEYIIYLSLYKDIKAKKIMENAQIIIRRGNTIIKSVSPYAQKPGFYWEKIHFTVQSNEDISIDVNNKGYIIFGAVPIIKKVE